MSDWKNKLDSAETISGKLLDKNQAWEKLYSRMDKKPAKKKHIYFQLAAAAILVLALIIFFQSRTKELVKPSEIVKQNPVISPNADKNAKEVIPEVVTMVPKITPEENKPLAVKKNKIEPTGSLSGNDTLDDVHINNDKPELVKAVEEIKIEPTVEYIAPKKKMKVIHINELGKPREEIIMAQQQPNRKFIFNNSSSIPGPAIHHQSGVIRVPVYSTN